MTEKTRNGGAVVRHQESSNEFVLRSSLTSARKNSSARLLLLSFFLLSGSLLLARAEDQIRAVRLSNVVGSVQLVNGPDSQFSQAYPNMPLMQGSTLKTGEDGRAEIQLEDGSVARLTPNSSATFSVLSRNSDGTNTELDLLTGLTYIEMTGTANARFAVHFGPNEVISPAPAKFRVNLDGNPVEFAVLDGSAHMSNGSAYSVDVRANETIRFDASDSSRYFLAQGVDGDSWDQWNADRDQAMSQMAAQQTREAIGSGNDPSYSDLDYYGNWYASNDGTNYWVPDGAGAGWDPYGSGYWGYYGGGGGYVWISGYPWGWAPYHCGTWNYFNPYWGWVPSGCGNRWYPVGGIGNVPSRYHRLPRPAVGLHPIPGGTRTGAKQTLIAVDRGPEATALTPRMGSAPRTIATEAGTAHLLPKAANPSNTVASRSASSNAVTTRQGYDGSQAFGSAPVYRSTSQNTGYRPGPSSSSSAPRYSAGSQASAYHGPSSSTSSASSPHASGGGAPAGGGGHVK